MQRIKGRTRSIAFAIRTPHFLCLNSLNSHWIPLFTGREGATFSRLWSGEVLRVPLWSPFWCKKGDITVLGLLCVVLKWPFYKRLSVFYWWKRNVTYTRGILASNYGIIPADLCLTGLQILTNQRATRKQLWRSIHSRAFREVKLTNSVKKQWYSFFDS